MATVGYTTVPGSTLSSGRGVAYAITMPEDGDVSSITGYLGVTAGQNIRAAIYDDSSLSPNNLVAESQELAISTTTTGWHTCTFASDVALVSGTTYWIAFQQGSGTTSYVMTFYYDANASANRGSWEQTYSVWEDPHGGFDAVANQDMGMYATYTPAAAGSAGLGFGNPLTGGMNDLTGGLNG